MAKLMSAQLSMFDLMTCEASDSAISSQGFLGGGLLELSPEWTGGPIGGARPRHARRSQSPGKSYSARNAQAETLSGALDELASQYAQIAATHGLPTVATFGRKSGASSPSAALQELLASKLQAAKPLMRGSPEYGVHWKFVDTLLGPPICRLAPSMRRISERDYSGALPWPTPTANEHTRGAGTIRPHDTGIPLTQRVAQMTAWPTPKASDGDGGRTTKTEGGGNWHLPIATREASPRATPSARDWQDSAGMSTPGVNPDGTERARLDQLPRQAQAWSTPRASDGEKGGPNMSFGAGGQPLPAQAAGMTPHGSPGQTEKPAASRGQLNPVFVGWLQGFPPEWTRAGLAVERKRSRSSRKA